MDTTTTSTEALTDLLAEKRRELAKVEQRMVRHAEDVKRDMDRVLAAVASGQSADWSTSSHDDLDRLRHVRQALAALVTELAWVAAR